MDEDLEEEEGGSGFCICLAVHDENEDGGTCSSCGGYVPDNEFNFNP